MTVTFFVAEAQAGIERDDDLKYMDDPRYYNAQLNAANRNAIIILDAAGKEITESGLIGSLTADEADEAASNLIMGAQYLIAPSTSQEPGRAKMIDCGLGWDQIERYAEGMKRIANLAREFETEIQFC